MAGIPGGAFNAVEFVVFVPYAFALRRHSARVRILRPISLHWRALADGGHVAVAVFAEPCAVQYIPLVVTTRHVGLKILEIPSCPIGNLIVSGFKQGVNAVALLHHWVSGDVQSC